MRKKKSRIKKVCDQVTEIFLNFQKRYESDIALDIAYSLGGRIRGKYRNTQTVNPNPEEDWRYNPECMSFYLYWLGYSEEAIGGFSSPKSSPGISQQSVSSRLDKAARIFQQRFGRDFRESPSLVKNRRLVEARAILLKTAINYIREIAESGEKVPATVDEIVLGFSSFLYKEMRSRKR